MKKLLLTSVALVALSGSAFAADLPTRKAPPAPPAPAPVWTGFYAGVNFGGGWNTNTGPRSVWYPDAINGGLTQWTQKGNGFGGILGGPQVGYNYQFNKIASGIGAVVGAEADFQGTNMVGGAGPQVSGLVNIPTNYSPLTNNGYRTVIGYQYAQKAVPWFGTVRGRVGLTIWPSLLVYGTGGFAYGYVTQNAGWTNNSALQTGWTAGGGAEWMFMQNWSAKIEYLYTQIYGGNNNTWINAGYGVNNVNNHTTWNTIRAGVNYHFNFTPAPTVVAKY